MRRALTFCAIATVLFMLFSLPASASDASEEYLEKFYEAFGGEQLSGRIGVEELLSEIILALTDGGGRIFTFLAFSLGGAMLVAASSMLTEGKSVQSATVGLVVIGMYSQIYELAGYAMEALEKMSEMFFTLIPIMCGVTLAGGGVSTAGAEATSMGIVFGAVSGVLTPLFLPLVSLMLVISVCASLGGEQVGTFFARVRSVFIFFLGIATSVLLGGVALQRVICSAKDSAAMRVAKYSASGLLPIIGTTVSASLSSLASGLDYAKSIIGAQGIYVILVTALSPLVLILAYRMVLSLSCTLLSFIGAEGGARPFSYLTFSFDALLSVYAVSLLLYTFEIVMFMKSGVSLI